jgi:hypothetical protein
MPLPPHIISVSAFLCERILREADGVITAVRIVDFFNVQGRPLDTLPLRVIQGIQGELVPTVQFCACLIIKAKPGRYVHQVQFKVQGTEQELTNAGAPILVTVESSPGVEGEVPSGAAIIMEMNIGVKRFGTSYVCILLDGEEAIRVPFTLRSLPDKNG